MGYEADIHEAALALGGEVADLLRPARELQARTDRLGQELVALRGAEEKRRNELVQQVAAGKLAPAEIPAKLTSDWVLDSPASMVLVHANVSLYANATRVAREAAPEIFAAMQKRIAKIVDESARLAATVPGGVIDEMTALRAGPEHHKTWSRLRALVNDWTACFDLLAVMQRAQWVAGPTHPRDHDDAVIFQRYRRPLSLPPGYWQGPRELRLAKAAATVAAPGLYSWQDALERWQRVDRRRREWRVFSSVQSMDAWGSVTTLESGPERPQDNVPIPIGSQPIVPAV